MRTGAALVFQRDYQDLKELFSKVPKDIKAERKTDRKEVKEDKKAARDSVQAVTPAQDSARNNK